MKELCCNNRLSVPPTSDYVPRLSSAVVVQLTAINCNTLTDEKNNN